MKHIAKKRFGQNFLTDQSVINSLVEAISPQPDDLMVEIGPGLGALTKPLLQKLICCMWWRLTVTSLPGCKKSTQKTASPYTTRCFEV